jgi:hypothetical protein
MSPDGLCHVAMCATCLPPCTMHPMQGMLPAWPEVVVHGKGSAAPQLAGGPCDPDLPTPGPSTHVSDCCCQYHPYLHWFARMLRSPLKDMSLLVGISNTNTRRTCLRPAVALPAAMHCSMATAQPIESMLYTPGRGRCQFTHHQIADGQIGVVPLHITLCC